MNIAQIKQLLRGLDFEVVGQSSIGVVYVECKVPHNVARRWLSERNHNNRKISTKRVAQFTRDIKSGRWEFNNESIAFDSSGFILDGQHRLKSIVHCGATLLLQLQFNHSFVVCDKGQARSVAEQRRRQGLRSDGRYVSAVKVAIQLKKRLGRTDPISDGEIGEYELRHPEAIRWISEQQLKKGIPASVWGALLYCYNMDSRLVTGFTTGLIQLEGLRKGSPVAALRNYIASDRSRAHQTTNRDLVINATLSAVQKEMLGRECSFIRVSADRSIRDWFADRLTQVSMVA